MSKTQSKPADDLFPEQRRAIALLAAGCSLFQTAETVSVDVLADLAEWFKEPAFQDALSRVPCWDHAKLSPVQHRNLDEAIKTVARLAHVRTPTHQEQAALDTTLAYAVRLTSVRAIRELLRVDGRANQFEAVKAVITAAQPVLDWIKTPWVPARPSKGSKHSEASRAPVR